MRESAQVSNLLGKVLVGIDNKGDNELIFKCEDGSQYKMYHEQDCCENVRLEEVIGDLADLIGTPLLMAEEVDGVTPPADDYAESETWTFYKFRTIKGSVDLRWYGSSNGYYSERVDFEKIA